MTNKPVTEAREIYRINNILRQYRINFYYSLRKDAIFLFEGRSVKSRITAAYLLAAFGGLMFLFSILFPDFFISGIGAYITLPIAFSSFLAGSYILFDFYSKIRHQKTKTMLTRNGISFREKNQFEYWPEEKIKHFEVVFSVSKKETMKPNFDEKNLRKVGRIIVFNHIGESRNLVSITNTNRQAMRDDLEETASFIQTFCGYKRKTEVRKPNLSSEIMVGI